MFDKFEVLMSWRLSWDLSFLLFGVSNWHIFFDFFKLLPLCYLHEKWKFLWYLGTCGADFCFLKMETKIIP